MIRFASICAALMAASLIASPLATAQNRSQIETVAAGKSCKGCDLFQANLSYRDMPRVDLSGSRLRQSDLSLTTMNGADFAGADISVSNLFGGRFTGANFAGANLTRSSLVGTYFGGANLKGANLTGANLSGAELQTVKGLTQAQLDTACGDGMTKLPRGLRIPACR